jgi:hypothetical protein
MQRLTAAPQPRLRRWFWILLIANALFIVATGLYLQPLTSRAIMDFELAKETVVAERIIQTWQSTGLLHKAIESVYIDFLFIVLYTTGLSVASVFMARLTRHEILVRAGNFFSYLVISAGICDVIENVAMLKSLHGTVHAWNVILAYDMAATKFSMLILTILFMGSCLVFTGLGRITLRKML